MNLMHYKKYISDLFTFVKSKYSSESRSEFLWFFCGQSVIFVLNFIIIKLISSLGTSEFGKYALVLTINSFFAMIWFGPAAQGFNRFFYIYITQKGGKSYLALIKRFLIITGFSFSIIILTVFIGVSSIFNFELALFYLISGVFITNLKLDEFANNLLNLIRKRKINSIIQLIEKIILISFLILTNWIDFFNLTNILIGFAILSISFFLIKLNYFNKLAYNNLEDNTEFDRKEIKKIIKHIIGYVSPFIIWGFAAWLQLNGDKWIIEKYLSTSDVGIYAIMIFILNAFITIPSNFIGEFLSPIIYKQFSATGNRDMQKSGFTYIKINVLSVFVLSCIAFIFSIFLGKEIIYLISSSEFTAYWYLLPTLCIGLGLFYTGQSMTIVGMVFNKPTKYLLPKIFIGAASILLNILFVNLLGIEGIALTVLLIGIIYIIFIITINSKLISSDKTYITN